MFSIRLNDLRDQIEHLENLVDSGVQVRYKNIDVLQESLRLHGQFHAMLTGDVKIKVATDEESKLANLVLKYLDCMELTSESDLKASLQMASTMRTELREKSVAMTLPGGAK